MTAPRCPECKGTGECRRCQGEGVDFEGDHYSRCEDCSGSGECTACFEVRMKRSCLQEPESR